MKKFSFIMLIALLFVSCKVQRTPEEIAAGNQAFEKAALAVKNKHFVLMADEVRVGYETTPYFAPRQGLNFMYVRGNEGVIQFDSWFNFNGVGGITIKGRVTNYEVKTDKKGEISVSYSIHDAAVGGQVTFWITPGSNQVRADFHPDFISGNVSIRGEVKPYNPNMDGVTIEGSSLFGN